MKPELLVAPTAGGTSYCMNLELSALNTHGLDIELDWTAMITVEGKRTVCQRMVVQSVAEAVRTELADQVCGVKRAWRSSYDREQLVADYGARMCKALEVITGRNCKVEHNTLTIRPPWWRKNVA